MGRILLGLAITGAGLLLWALIAGTAALPVLDCGVAAQCELAADDAALRTLSHFNSAEARRALTGPERGQLGDTYANLVLSGRIVRVKAGTRVHVIECDPLNVSGSPRYARIQVMEGEWAGKELLTSAVQVSTGRDRNR